MAGRFSVDAVFRAIDKMSAPIAKMQSRLDRFAKSAQKGIEGLDKASDRWLSSVTKASAGLALAATASSAALAAAARPGMDFEQQMADLGAAYLKTRGEIAPLEKAALQLGASTKFSATEVAGAMESMAKAGFSEEQALAGIEGMTYAAAAAGEDLVETSANISAVMKGMGIPIADTIKVADVLTLASVKTASSISSLGESMAKVGPVARQLGVPLNDVVAMVASLQDAGLDASEAGSATATMLTMMSKPTDAMRAKMKKLGISFHDAAGNMKSPQLVLGELVKAGKGVGGNMQQLAFFADLVGLRGQKAAINLQKLFESGDYTKLVTALEGAGGKAKEMADLRMDTLTGDIDKMTESVKTLAIDAYGAQSSGLREITQGMTNWIDKNRELIGQDVNATFKLIANNFEGIVRWGTRLAKIIAVVTGVALAVKGWAGAVWLLNAAVTANPITLWIVALTALVALVVAFWPEISALFAAIWDGIAAVASAIWDGVKSIGGAIYDGLAYVFEPIIAIWRAAWTGIFEFYVGVLTLIVGAAKAVLTPIFEFLRPIVTAVFDFILAKWTWVFDMIKSVVSFAFDEIVWLIETDIDIICAIAQAAYDTIAAVWGGLADVFGAIWEAIKVAFEKTLGPVFEKIAWAVEKIRSIGRETLGTADADEPNMSSASVGAPQVVSPSERVAQSISETTTTNQSEVTIKDQTGRAEVTKKPPAGAVSLRMRRSGAF